MRGVAGAMMAPPGAPCTNCSTLPPQQELALLRAENKRLLAALSKTRPGDFFPGTKDMESENKVELQNAMAKDADGTSSSSAAHAAHHKLRKT